MGVSLETALDSVRDWRAGRAADDKPLTAEEIERRKEAEIVAKNERALSELRRMMPGLGV